METKTTGTEMSAAYRVEARMRLEVVIGDVPPGENLKSILPQIARKLGFGERRTRALWGGECARIDAHEMDRLRRAAASAENLRIAAKLDGAAHALLAFDADFHGPEIARIRALADRHRALARGEGEG
jgi:hypothetical protein